MKSVPLSRVDILETGPRMTDREESDGSDIGVGVVSKTSPKTKRPSLYKVLLLNDDYTPQEFVFGCFRPSFTKMLKMRCGS